MTCGFAERSLLSLHEKDWSFGYSGICGGAFGGREEGRSFSRFG